MHPRLLALVALAIVSCADARAAEPNDALRCVLPAWHLVYHHDPEGARIAGDKQALFAAIRRGDPVRLVWGMSGKDGQISVEHAAEPVFVSIAGNREAYAQLPEHGLQKSYHEPGQALIADASMLWRAVMGTDGRFDALWADRTDNDPVRRLPQRAAIRWLAYAPDPRCDSRPVPAVAVPRGVRRVEPAPSP